MKSKHHNSAIHLGDNARIFENRIVDCFTQERKGKLVKVAADSICNTDRFERTAYLRIVHDELRNLACPDLWSNRLKGATRPYPELANSFGASECLVAKSVYWAQVMYSVGDGIFVDAGTPCFVEAALCLDGLRFALLVSPCTAAEHVTLTASRWEMHRGHSGVLFLDEGRAIKHAAMWDLEDALHVLVLER